MGSRGYYASLFLILTFFKCFHSQDNVTTWRVCDSGWFGDDCQYKCRCTNNNCFASGICTDGAECVTGWFGPGCQYEDLAVKGRTTFGIANELTTLVTDGDDDTCLSGHVLFQSPLILSMNTEYPFTWLRLRYNESAVWPSSFQLRFSNTKSTPKLETDCVNRRNTSPSENTLDIHCDLNVTVDQVILAGAGVNSLCSLHISGGRNVALKQKTYQSSTLINTDYGSSMAVDGITSGDFGGGSCTHTQTERYPSWSVELSRPQMVHRYVLYNRNDQQDRLKGFVIESFASDGTTLFRHKDTEKKPLDVYTLTSANLIKPVARVNITAEKILTLCEVELFSECPPTTFGVNCEYTCSPHCTDQHCDQVTGHCLSCPPGKRGLLCTKDCPTSQYGQDCSQNCTTDCLDQLCEPATGHCQACTVGKRGSFCQEACDFKTYGLGCNFTCSSHCLVDELAQPAVCHPITGTCLLGCDSGYEGLTCKQEAWQLGVGTVIGLDILFICLLILAIAGGLWYLYRRRTRNAKPLNCEFYDLNTQPRGGSPRDPYTLTFGNNRHSGPPRTQAPSVPFPEIIEMQRKSAAAQQQQPPPPSPRQQQQQLQQQQQEQEQQQQHPLHEEEDEGDTYEEVSQPLMTRSSYDQLPKIPRGPQATTSATTVPKQIADSRNSYVTPDQGLVASEDGLTYENLDDQRPLSMRK